ncbi:MAG: hypothetical protein AAGF12_35335 [Myxococcota bacterium]
MNQLTGDRDSWSDEQLSEIEKEYELGLTVQEIVQLVTQRGVRLTEATFRKYVQLGLLPRSVRVGRKGKHRGSQGRYPVSALRQLDNLRRLMKQGYTIEQIQREFLFVRGDIDALERQLARVFSAMEKAAERGSDEFIERALFDARELGAELQRKLQAVEQRLTMRARMARAVV